MSTEQKRNSIQWTLWKQLDDLDFSDDLALISHTQQQVQEKTNYVSQFSACLGLYIHKGKSQVLKINTKSNTPILPKGSNLDDVDRFTYLGSIIDTQGGTDSNLIENVQSKNKI